MVNQSHIVAIDENAVKAASYLCNRTTFIVAGTVSGSGAVFYLTSSCFYTNANAETKKETFERNICAQF